MPGCQHELGFSSFHRTTRLKAPQNAKLRGSGPLEPGGPGVLRVAGGFSWLLWSTDVGNVSFQGFRALGSALMLER